MEEGRATIVFILCFSYAIRNCGAAITPVDETYNVQLAENLKIRWEFDNEGDVFNVEWSFQNKTAASPTSIMLKVQTNPAQKLDPNFINIKHDGNGNVTITGVTPENEGIYYCTVAYTQAVYPTVTGTATVKIESTTTPDKTPACGTGCIIGIVIGVILFLALITVGIGCCVHHNNANQLGGQNQQDNGQRQY